MKTAWLFPGQGSQFIGMGRELYREFSPAREILDQASDLSGFSLARYCFQGPGEMLTRTDILHPALAAVSLGCVIFLQSEGLEPDIVAGHSLGEYAALYTAEVLSLEDTLKIVIQRGRLMHKAAQKRPGAMAALIGMDYQTTLLLLKRFRDRWDLNIANVNAPDQIVISGETDGIALVEQAAAQCSARVVRLNVSGAWHSSLMEEAAEEFRIFLQGITFKLPQVPILLNVTGSEETDPVSIRSCMSRQMTSTVRWYETVQAMIRSGVQRFLEVGPGKVLRSLIRRIWTDVAAYQIYGISASNDLKYLRRKIV